MLEAIGATGVEELYADIPDRLRLRGEMNLPEPLISEYALRRHVEGMLDKNRTAREMLSFLGAGCSQHYVPAVCDEVNQRGEFLTAYAGEPYDDHGRFQTLFEYSSMMGELLNMDIVNVPTYDGFQAAATSIRMAARITDRREILISAAVGREKLSKIRDYCKPDLTLREVARNPSTGGLNLGALDRLLSGKTAAVYFENPTYLGLIESEGNAISEAAHSHGAVSIVGADPVSLGVLKPPVEYGADIVCGDIQPLGMHMQFGGGQAGYIATRDEERYVSEFPSRLFGIAPTSVPGEYGFGDVLYDRTSFAKREEGKEWVGTAAALWGITAAVYLALLGPRGIRDLGAGIMERTRYAMLEMEALEGVSVPHFDAPHFKEFLLDYSGTGRTVAQIHQGLLERGIMGGKDLSNEFPEMDRCALFCVTEVHTKTDIDSLAAAMKEVLHS
jgi:glycine dehydrogenase subunit 1